MRWLSQSLDTAREQSREAPDEEQLLATCQPEGNTLPRSVHKIADNWSTSFTTRQTAEKPEAGRMARRHSGPPHGPHDFFWVYLEPCCCPSRWRMKIVPYLHEDNSLYSLTRRSEAVRTRPKAGGRIPSGQILNTCQPAPNFSLPSFLSSSLNFYTSPTSIAILNSNPPSCLNKTFQETDLVSFSVGLHPQAIYVSNPGPLPTRYPPHCILVVPGPPGVS